LKKTKLKKIKITLLKQFETVICERMKHVLRVKLMYLEPVFKSIFKILIKILNKNRFNEFPVTEQENRLYRSKNVLYILIEIL